MFSKNPLSRRNFLILAGATGAGVLEGCSKSGQPREDAGTAIEILDRQHGVIRRAIAILDEIRREMNAQMDISTEITGGAVGMVRTFMINYHQQMEEKHIYPVFDAAGKMSGLVGVLREQHTAASRLTEILRKLCVEFSPKDQEKRRRMVNAIHLFNRMSGAHASREDTVLFPLLRRIMHPKSYAELSSVFQRAETEFLGQKGFDETIGKLAYYENSLGIGNLASFTPRAEDLN